MGSWRLTLLSACAAVLHAPTPEDDRLTKEELQAEVDSWPKKSTRDPSGRCFGTFGYTLDGHLHLYETPVGQPGDSITIQCNAFQSASGPKPYRYGSFELECTDGQWALVNPSVMHCDHDGDKVNGQMVTTTPAAGACLRTRFRMSVHGHTKDYQVRNGNPGEEVELHCDHGPYNRGTFTLRCDGGKWMRLNPEEFPCTKDPAAPGTCLVTTFTLTMNDYEHTVILPEGDDGETTTVGCDVGPYTKGKVDFKCEDDKWRMVQPVVPCEKPAAFFFESFRSGGFLAHTGPH